MARTLVGLVLLLAAAGVSDAYRSVRPVGSRPVASRSSAASTAVVAGRRSSTTSSTAMHLFRRKWSPGMTVGMVKKTPDFLAALSYVAATMLQWSLILGFLHVFQLHGLENLPELVAALPTQVAAYLPALETISTYLVGVFTFFMALRSRVFSPLDNSRPSPTANDPVFKERRRPWWTPPPLAFPLIWTTIAFLRSISTAMVFRSTGTLLCLPIFAFFGHLSIGDTWNTVNNVEKRLGTATLGVFFVWASAVYTTLLYYETLPLAGKVLAPSCAWLTVAMFLVYSIWRLNSLYLSEQYTLFPSVEEGPRSAWRLPFTSLKK